MQYARLCNNNFSDELKRAGGLRKLVIFGWLQCLTARPAASVYYRFGACPVIAHANTETSSPIVMPAARRMIAIACSIRRYTPDRRATASMSGFNVSGNR